MAEKTYDGTEIFAGLTGLSKDQVKTTWDGVRQNHAKLAGCQRHRFTATTVKMGDKLTCESCGGTIYLTDVGNYIRGYQAAGGDARDVWPAWTEKRGN